MKLATTMIYEILNTTPEFNEINFFTNSIPEENRKVDQLPVGRIVEIEGDYGNFASGDPQTITFYIQLDIWVRNLSDAQKYYFKLDSILRNNSWLNTYSSIEEDPDLKNAKRIIKRYNGTFRLEIN